MTVRRTISAASSYNDSGPGRSPPPPAGPGHSNGVSVAGGGEALNLVADARLLAGTSLTSTLETAFSGVVERIAERVRNTRPQLRGRADGFRQLGAFDLRPVGHATPGGGG